jgi:hypothetical protein
MENNSKSAGDYVSDFLSHIVNGLPRFIEALVILLIGYLIAKAVAAAVHNILGRAQLNQRLHSGAGGNFIQRALPNPMGHRLLGHFPVCPFNGGFRTRDSGIH